MTARHSLDQIERGLDGVTAGPWFEGDHWVFVNPSTGEPTHPLENIFDHDKPQANAAHIARCSPDAIREIAAYVRDLEERLAKAAEALEPFMERAERFDEIPGVYLCHDNVELWQDGNWRCDLTVGDLRRARTALSQIRSEK